MKYCGNFTGAGVLIHGGAGSRKPEGEHGAQAKAKAREILLAAWEKISSGTSALDTVIYAVELLEASPYFNAGLGSSLQSDGVPRLSASLMDGTRERFSAVALVTNLVHPSKIAQTLQNRDDRVIGPIGAQLLARELGVPPQDPRTPRQVESWYRSYQNKVPNVCGTVGAVARDQSGHLAACTSTGGRGNEFPDRISDVSTIAGNYASTHGAISCTGIGEQIIDAGLAVRLETRLRDGQSLTVASDLCLQEATTRKQQYGWIAVDRTGDWVIYHTTEDITAAVLGREGKDLFAC